MNVRRNLIGVLGIAFMFNAVASADHGPGSFGGFADARMEFNQFTNAGVNNSSNNPTFSVADGAVYYWTTVGNGKVYVDIPFMWGAAGTNAFVLGTNKAQAYVNFKYDCGLWWQLGQFDSPFGYEKNDSKDLSLASQGLVYLNTPVTHTGLMAGYAFTDQVWFKAFAANQFNQGQRNDVNFEYAGWLGYNGDMFNLAAGYKHQKAATGNSTMMVDVQADTKLGDLDTAVEFLASKSGLAGAQTGIGIMGLFNYHINDKWMFGLRPEYTSKLGAIYYSAFQIAGGPSTHLTDHLTVKANYTFLSSKATSTAASVTSHGGAIAAVHTF